MNRLWQGVRMRQVAASADPDQTPRLVTLPVSWDDRAAAALAALAPGTGPVILTGAAAPWLASLAQKDRQSGGAGSLAQAMHTLLRLQRAAPNEATWRGDMSAPGFILNLAAFHDAATGFDVPGFAEAATHTARACRLLAPDAPAYQIGLAGLDDLLAAIGLDYATPASRSVAACVAALFRGRIARSLAADQRDLLATGADWPSPPRSCIPGLSDAAAAERRAAACEPGAKIAACVLQAGPVEALLGIETGGIAPAFSPVRDGHLTRAAQHRLAAAGLSPEAALALAIQGDTPLPTAGAAAHAAMHEAVAPYLQRMPPHPATLPVPAGATLHAAPTQPGRRRLPDRHRGLTQKTAVGGHRVFLRTGEYADGTLGEIGITVPRENPAMRGLMEAFCEAVTIGLQHGATLEAFATSFAHTSFGPSGLVEGDPDIAQASSILDYVFRSLSATYLGTALPDPELAITREPVPLLPLDLPASSPAARRRGLRLVA